MLPKKATINQQISQQVFAVMNRTHDATDNLHANGGKMA
jgi:hypothetical protein